MCFPREPRNHIAAEITPIAMARLVKSFAIAFSPSMFFSSFAILLLSTATTTIEANISPTAIAPLASFEIGISPRAMIDAAIMAIALAKSVNLSAKESSFSPSFNRAILAASESILRIPIIALTTTVTIPRILPPTMIRHLYLSQKFFTASKNALRFAEAFPQSSLHHSAKESKEPSRSCTVFLAVSIAPSLPEPPKNPTIPSQSLEKKSTNVVFSLPKTLPILPLMLLNLSTRKVFTV